MLNRGRALYEDQIMGGFALKPLQFLPVKVPLQKGPFDLYQVIRAALTSNEVELQDHDILVISSKFMAMSEGRFVRLDKIVPSKSAEALARRIQISSVLAELVLNEGELVLPGVPGFALAVKDRLLAPNAGIDRSNIFPGWAILYPSQPFEYARRLRRRFLKDGLNIGILVTDSRLMPTRIGTTGVTVAVAGFEPVIDERGRTDLFGNTLKVTQRAIADDICSGAQILMGEADEATPLVVARNTGVKFSARPTRSEDLAVRFEECIYVRGLSGGRPRVIARGRRQQFARKGKKHAF